MKNSYKGFVFGVVMLFQSLIYAATATSQLDKDRILLFDDYAATNSLPVATWVHEGIAPVGLPATIGGLLAGSNHYHHTGWVFLNCRMGQRNSSGARYVPPQMATNYISSQLTTNYSVNLMNRLSAYIYSPVLTNGVGTLYFEAINVSSNNEATLSVDIATNMVGGAALSGSMSTGNVDWIWKFDISLNAQTIDDFERVMLDFDIRQPVALRIGRSSVNNNGTQPDNFYACIDNIRVSPSAPDIVFSGIKASINGGDMVVECVVSNSLDSLNLTDNTSRDIQLFYRGFSDIATNDWASTPMIYESSSGISGDGEEWKATIAGHAPDMSFEYYFVYSRNPVYRSPDYTEQGHVYLPETGIRYPEIGTYIQPPGEAVPVNVSFYDQGAVLSVKEYFVARPYSYTGGLLSPPAFLGHTFDGWYTNDTYDGAVVIESSLAREDVTALYAKWTINTYIIRYNANGGSGNMNDSVFTYGTETSLTSNEFIRTGYDFSGWTTNASSTMVVYTNGENILNLSTIHGSTNNLYAVWTGHSYKVSFNAPNGSVVPSEIDVTYGSPYGMHNNNYLPTPLRTGYAHEGWYLEPNGGGSKIIATTPVAINNNHTLYANWTANQYTVTFNTQGGSVLPGTKNVTYDGVYGALPVPIRSGFIFSGWFSESDGGTPITESTRVVIPAAHDIFVQWVSNTDWYTTNTTETTYHILNEEELKGFSFLVNEGTNFVGKTVVLGADIGMTSLWIPIGANTAVFDGTFDGQGKKLSGLTNSASSSDVGLFGALGINGIIKNVVVTDCLLTSSANVGGLVGNNRGLVQNCQVLSGEIKGTGGSSVVGGLVGLNEGMIQNGFSTALVNTGTVGGIAGQNSSGATIQNSYWLDTSATGAIGNNIIGSTTNNLCSFTGTPGTLNETVSDTKVLSVALNTWVQVQNSPFYWWTEGTGTSYPVLTQFAPSLVTRQLSESRILLFDDYASTNHLSGATWVHEGIAPAGLPATVGGLLIGSNHYHRTGWVFLNCRMGQRNTPGVRYIPPQMATNYIPSQLTTNYSVNLMNRYSAYIYSPVFTNGIGKLYFEAINVSANNEATLSVDIATTMDGGAALSGSMSTGNVDWVWKFDISLNAQTIDDFERVMLDFDIRQPVALRIRRSSVNNNGTQPDNFYVCIDNIRVSPPSADIEFSKPLVPFKVGYPSVNTPEGQVQCWIDNRKGPYVTSYLGGTRTNVQVVSRWNYIPRVNNPLQGWISLWQTNKLECVDAGNGSGEGEKWEGGIPAYPDVGSLEYYFIGAFNGVRYQSPDYTERNYYYPPENPSPRIYSSGMTTNAVSGLVSTNTAFQFEIRQFPATFGKAVAMTDQFGPVPMYLSGTNEWQARVSVVGTSISNITWYFEGSGEYLGNYTFSSDTVYWCNQTGMRTGELPYGDNCLRTHDPDVATDEAYRLEVKVIPEESSYVLLTLNTAQTNFMAGRGEYQDFNGWNPGEAGEQSFTDTSDKYPKTSYSQNFDSWVPSTFSSISNFFGTVSLTNHENQVYAWPEDAVGTIDWLACHFEYAFDRTAVKAPPDAPGIAWRNQAIRLMGGSNPALGLGYIQGNEYQVSRLPGLGAVSFKARLSQKIIPGSYNRDASVHLKHYASSNYYVRAMIRCVSPSVERPSVSVIGYYQSMYNFYEYRVTQIPDPTDIDGSGNVHENDNLIQHQIIRWDNGEPMVLGSATSSGKLTTMLNGNNMLEFRLYTESTGGVSLVGRLGGASAADNISVPVPSINSIKFGTFGIHSSECIIEMSDIQIGPTTATAAVGVGVPSSQFTPAGDWALSLQYVYSSNRITSLAPTNQIQVLIRKGTSSPWTTNKVFTITGFEYANFTSDIQTADPTYLRLQIVGRRSPALPSSDVVVDAIIGTRWRGENRPEQNISVNEWAVTEARLVSNPAGGGFDNKISVHMDATQADSIRPQSIRSPRIMGIGTISFDYRSLSANDAAIQIQYSTDGNPGLTAFDGWVDVTNIVCNSSAWTTASIYIGQFAATNLFVRFLNDWYGSDAQSSMNSIIEIDNITIWNNPTNSPNDWVGYNIKVTNIETNRWWIDGIDGGRNASLNNSTTNLAFPSPQGAFNPYIMSPKLKRGLGRISFIARAYDPTNALVQNTSISVYATKAPWSMTLFDHQWEKLHTFSEITNAFYRPFSFAVTNVDNSYTAVKLVVDGVTVNTPDVQRVCIDEILVSESIYAKFDISNVRLMLPDSLWAETHQPLEGEDIGIEAQLTNVLLAPSNIMVYVSYVIGSDTWGVMNAPQDKRVTLPMDLVDSQQRIYRTREPALYYGIPEQDNNTIVQYLVWATYEDSGQHTVSQKSDSFVNPKWYYPVDLNEIYSASGWSPYYIVYDVPPGSVWINEVNAFEYWNGVQGQTWEGNAFIEIAMPAWVNLNGWSVECVKGTWPVVTSTPIWLLGDLPVMSPHPDANGYAFFVIGPSTPPPGVTAFAFDYYKVPNLGGDNSGNNSLMPRLQAGGLRLKRPLGMYEQPIAYDDSPVWGDSGATWAQNDPDRLFKYVGREIEGGTLSFTGRVGSALGEYMREDNTNTWAFLNWTPGAPNIGQIMPDAPLPGGLNVLITSEMNSLHGLQNNVRTQKYLLKVRRNESTNIVYQADNWYRLYSVKEEGAERLPQSPTNSYTLYLNNIQSNVTVNVQLDVREDLQGMDLPSDLMDWLSLFPDLPLAPTYLNVLGSSSQLTLRERYWINANPVTTNVFTFNMHLDDELSERPLYVTLEAAINSNKIDRLQGGSVMKAMATYDLSPSAWFMTSQFVFGDDTFDADKRSRVHINAFPDQPAYFRWSLELEDPRASTFLMINQPKP